MDHGKGISVLLAQGLEVSNLLKDVPNFLNDVSNFFKDVPKVLMSILGWEMTSNHFLRAPNEQTDRGNGDRGLK